MFDGTRRLGISRPIGSSRRGLGYVPEDRRIFTDLTVEENLEVGRQPPRAERAAPGRREKLFALFPNLARDARPPGRRA